MTFTSEIRRRCHGINRRTRVRQIIEMIEEKAEATVDEAAVKEVAAEEKVKAKVELGGKAETTGGKLMIVTTLTKAVDGGVGVTGIGGGERRPACR